MCACRSMRARPRQPVGSPKIMLVVGGQSPKAIRSVECFDFAEGQWTLVQEMPIRRCRAGLAVMGNEVRPYFSFEHPRFECAVSVDYGHQYERIKSWKINSFHFQINYSTQRGQSNVFTFQKTRRFIIRELCSVFSLLPQWVLILSSSFKYYWNLRKSTTDPREYGQVKIRVPMTIPKLNSIGCNIVPYCNLTDKKLQKFKRL